MYQSSLLFIYCKPRRSDCLDPAPKKSRLTRVPHGGSKHWSARHIASSNGLGTQLLGFALGQTRKPFPSGRRPVELKAASTRSWEKEAPANNPTFSIGLSFQRHPYPENRQVIDDRSGRSCVPDCNRRWKIGRNVGLARRVCPTQEIGGLML